MCHRTPSSLYTAAVTHHDLLMHELLASNEILTGMQSLVKGGSQEK